MEVESNQKLWVSLNHSRRMLFLALVEDLLVLARSDPPLKILVCRPLSLLLAHLLYLLEQMT